MSDIIFNPLLKKGFQEISGDTSQIERNVTQLQNDVTRIDTNLTKLQQSAAIKVYSTSALSSLTVDAIFQWQGETTTTAPILTKGYFYKKTASDTYAQLDTQPRLQNIANGNGGSIEISTNTRIAGNLTVSGTSTTVHAQQVESENDYITLRKNNPLGLSNGDYSGMEIDNYDGNNTNLKLVVGNDGWARVGDSGGTLQKLATIQENPTNGQFVKYNTTTKELESSTIDYSNVANTPGAATRSAAGLMSAADKTKLDGIATGANKYSLPTASAQTKGGVKVGDGLRITNEVLSVTDSAANKVTKVSTAAELDNLADGVLFQWQGADTDQLKYGYFYKLSITTQTIPAGTQYFEYPEGFPTINLNGYKFAPGKYYLVQDNTPAVTSNFFNLSVWRYEPNTDLYTVSDSSTIAVGQKFYNKNTLSYVTVTAISDHTITFSDGTSFTYTIAAGGGFDHLYHVMAENGNEFDFITTGMGTLVCHYALSGDVFSLLDWFRIQEPIMYTLADAITVTITTYAQTNTQPQAYSFIKIQQNGITKPSGWVDIIKVIPLTRSACFAGIVSVGAVYQTGRPGNIIASFNFNFNFATITTLSRCENTSTLTFALSDIRIVADNDNNAVISVKLDFQITGGFIVQVTAPCVCEFLF